MFSLLFGGSVSPKLYDCATHVLLVQEGCCKSGSLNVYKALGETGQESVEGPWLGESDGWSVVTYTRKVVGSIPGQDTCLGCTFDPWSGCVGEAPD